ncbi:MAG: heme-binding protein, partial [Flavobacteriales bacterium]|nr:heme-binding protein [Flavobacteriales bacterium]
VAVRFGGWADDQKIKENTEFLMKTLETMNIEPVSAPWYMGYNPPFQLVNRRNEVAVEVSAADMEIIKML